MRSATGDDLRRRIDPIDRRCYAFFHPALVDEPLIFVEVALTESISRRDRAHCSPKTGSPVPIERAPHRGVLFDLQHPTRVWAEFSFGNFLIKQVVEELRRELPKLENFVTLVSPVPGLHAMAEAGGRCFRYPTRTRALLAPSRRTGLVRQCRSGAAIAIGGRTAGRALFPESAHIKGPVDRFRSALPSRQWARGWSGSTGLAISRSRACANPPASWSTISIVSRISRRTTKPTPTQGEDRRIKCRGKKLLKTEGRRLLDMRAVVRADPSSFRHCEPLAPRNDAAERRCRQNLALPSRESSVPDPARYCYRRPPIAQYPLLKIFSILS